jgi:hypothetical protein
MHSSYYEGGNFLHALRLFKLMLSYMALLLQADNTKTKTIIEQTLIHLSLVDMTVELRERATSAVLFFSDLLGVIFIFYIHRLFA